MRTVFIGDIHGHDSWKKVVEKEKPDHVVFVGDYFDSFNVSAAEQIHNFKEIIAYKESSPHVHVIMLIGNHDHHYFPEVGYTGTSGFQSGPHVAIGQLLDENRHHLQMAYQYKDYLCTHAGVSPLWLKKWGWDGQESIIRFINTLWKQKQHKCFLFSGYNPYGDDVDQTPIWIRPRSLQKACQETKGNYIQIVGHTGVEQIDIEGKSTGGRYYYIDAMRAGQYLVHTEEEGLTLGQL